MDNNEIYSTEIIFIDNFENTLKVIKKSGLKIEESDMIFPKVPHLERYSFIKWEINRSTFNDKQVTIVIKAKYIKKEIIEVKNTENIVISPFDNRIYKSVKNNYQVLQVFDASSEKIEQNSVMISQRIKFDRFYVEDNLILFSDVNLYNDLNQINIFDIRTMNLVRSIVFKKIDDSEEYFKVIIKLVFKDYVIVHYCGFQAITDKIIIFRLSELNYKVEIPQYWDEFGVDLLVHDKYLILYNSLYQEITGIFLIYDLVNNKIIKKITGSEYVDFAFSVFTYGDYYLISSRGESSYALCDGYLDIYKFSYDKFHRRIYSDHKEQQNFGSEVVSSEDYIVISDPGFNDMNGALMIYKYSDIKYTKIIRKPHKLIINKDKEYFGGNLLINGNYVYISDIQYNDRQGIVFIVNLKTNEYTNIFYGENSMDEFGKNFAIFEDKLFISAPGKNSNSGRVYCYQNTEEEYTKESVLDPDEKVFSFGSTLQIVNGKILITGQSEEKDANIYIYEIKDLF